MKNTPIDGTTGPGTVVGANVALTGTLKDQNDIAIYGMVDGEVISENTVTVGQTAQIKGPVRGQIITIAGIVRGSIDASEKLELLETGKVYGSIAAKDLVIRSGAILVGKVTMGADEEAQAAEESATEEETAESKEVSEEETKAESESTEAALTPDEE